MAQPTEAGGHPTPRCPLLRLTPRKLTGRPQRGLRGAGLRRGRKVPLLCLFSHFEQTSERDENCPAYLERAPGCETPSLHQAEAASCLASPGSQPALGALWGASQPSTQPGRREGRHPDSSLGAPSPASLLQPLGALSVSGGFSARSRWRSVSSRRGRERKQRLAPFKAKAVACRSLSPRGPPSRVQGSGVTWTLARLVPAPTSAASPPPPTPRISCFIWWTWVFAVPLGSLLKRGY